MVDVDATVVIGGMVNADPDIKRKDFNINNSSASFHISCIYQCFQ